MSFDEARRGENNSISNTSQIKISPIKVPPGATQIGNYILGKTIGSGTYGKVHLGLHVPTGEKVAVKIIDKLKLSEKDLDHIHREIQILKRIMHPSLIQLYQIIQTKKSLLLVTQFMQNGELFNYIIQHQKLSEEEACKIFHQIMEGVQYMHNLGITHRDIKPENILIDYNGRVKIIDFGLSNFYEKNQKLRTGCGSPCYAAPEMIELKHQYQPLLVDIWSVGIVLFSMLAGYLPFCDPDLSKLYKKILIGSFKYPSWVSEQAKDLIGRMLVVNPQNRIKLSQIFEHEWYNKTKIKKSIGIDPRHYKIPFENSIIEPVSYVVGLKSEHLIKQIQLNKKSKETAFYYIIVKKLVKQKKQIKTFFGSDDFDQKKLSLLEDGSIDFQNIFANVQGVSPISNYNEKSPLVNSEDPLRALLKNLQLKFVLEQIMNNALEEEDKKLKMMKNNFYCNNPENKKKRLKLKLDIELQNITKKGSIKSLLKNRSELDKKDKISRVVSTMKRTYKDGRQQRKNMDSISDIIQLRNLIQKNLNINKKNPSKRIIHQKLAPLSTNKSREAHHKNMFNNLYQS